MKTQNKGRKRTGGVKFLIASMSLAASLVIWSVLSTQDQVSQVMAASDEGGSSQSLGLELDPLPTLVPMQISNDQNVMIVEVDSAQTTELRSVSAPEQKVQSVSSGSIVISQNNGGGSASSSGGGGSVTTTKSS